MRQNKSSFTITQLGEGFLVFCRYDALPNTVAAVNFCYRWQPTDGAVVLQLPPTLLHFEITRLESYVGTSSDDCFYKQTHT